MKDKVTLAAVLQYHVLAGNVSAGATLKINNAANIKPGVRAGNGVIHVIDTVLMPK